MSVHDLLAVLGEALGCILGLAVCLVLLGGLYGIRKGFTLRWSPPPQKDAPACDHAGHES
jgi:hypothetical protein